MNELQWLKTSNEFQEHNNEEVQEITGNMMPFLYNSIPGKLSFASCLCKNAHIGYNYF